MMIDTYIDAPDADANALDGEYLMILGDTGLYMREGVGMYSMVTGLLVNSGARLTLALNRDTGGNSGQDGTFLEFNNDVVNNGTIMPATLDTGTLNGGILETRDGLPATDTLGGGTWAGNMTSENINWKQFLNYTWLSEPIPEHIPTDEELFGAYLAKWGRD